MSEEVKKYYVTFTTTTRQTMWTEVYASSEKEAVEKFHNGEDQGPWHQEGDEEIVEVEDAEAVEA